jgi:chromosome segregation ATPase
LTIEGAIRITDGIVADKEREIEELKRVLEEQRRNVGEFTVGAAALTAAIEDDELIQQHRSQIEDLKRQWEEKLRAAEVETSIERAKLARERAELGEKQADFEKRLAECGGNLGAVVIETGDAKKAAGGRWLARLGLRDGDKD